MVILYQFPSSLLISLIPRLQNETSRPIRPKLLDFFLLQHAERLPREILPIDFFRVENVAQFIAGETVETDVVDIQLGADLGSTDFIPADRFPEFAQSIHPSSLLTMTHDFMVSKKSSILRQLNQQCSMWIEACKIDERFLDVVSCFFAVSQSHSTKNPYQG